MAVQLGQHLGGVLGQVRYQPTEKRVRVYLGTDLVAASGHPVLVWEPRRVTPLYAFPRAEVFADLEAGRLEPPSDPPGPILDPRVPFGLHTTSGTPQTVRVGGQVREGAAFVPADPELAELVVFDFAPFSWVEEDDPIVSHPHDPFHRIDVRTSDRHVRLELEGTLLADSRRPRLLFETSIPVTRYYLPREDVRVELRPSDTRTACAYKGQATYYSVRVGDRVLPDVAWSYVDPLTDGLEVAGLVCFLQERLDLVLDGAPQPRSWTLWA